MIRTASRILCIWLPNWPIQRFVVARPDLKLRGQILVLHREDRRRGFVISACSPRAQRIGVRVGMPLTEASSLLRKLPSASPPTPAINPVSHSNSANVIPDAKLTMRIERHDESADEHVLRDLAVRGEAFSPLVGYRTTRAVARSTSRRSTSQGNAANRAALSSESLDCLYWDITRSRRVFGSEEALVHAVLEWLGDEGYFGRSAVADTLGAAWALAHYASSVSSDSTSTTPPTGQTSSSAGTCTSTWSHPSPVFAVSGRAVEAIGPLPIEALRLSPGPRDQLRQLGVLRVEQLLALPRTALAARLGSEVLERIDQALGDREEKIDTEQATPDFVAEQLLEHSTSRLDSLEQVVQRLLCILSHRLQEQQTGALQIRGYFGCVNQQRWSWEIGLYAPSHSVEHWWELIRIQFENLRLPDRVQEVHVEVPRTAPLIRHQTHLFGNGSRYAPRQLAFLIDCLSSRLGREAILGLQLRRDPLPERAFGFHPLTGNSRGPGQKMRNILLFELRSGQPGPSSNSQSSAAPGQMFRWSDRPLRLYPSPLPLDVLSVVPEGPPIRFRCRVAGSAVAHVTQWWGPERIETGWWRGRSVRRDYYRVQVRSGHRFWIFRQRHDGRWFLHGEY